MSLSYISMGEKKVSGKMKLVDDAEEAAAAPRAPVAAFWVKSELSNDDWEADVVTTSAFWVNLRNAIKWPYGPVHKGRRKKNGEFGFIRTKYHQAQEQRTKKWEPSSSHFSNYHRTTTCLINMRAGRPSAPAVDRLPWHFFPVDHS
mmetsp:Transcript_28071/g.41346  ORF Transcript_28071/g.41346 Transcript_28071/m.41346 type:complete len:146 (+) Transcript_28071:976-1413(+)